MIDEIDPCQVRVAEAVFFESFYTDGIFQGWEGVQESGVRIDNLAAVVLRGLADSFSLDKRTSSVPSMNNIHHTYKFEIRRENVW